MPSAATSMLPIGRDVRLDDRYRLDEGSVLMTGVQALVRMVLDQMRADRLRGHRTGALVTGYPGSPLGGFDGEFTRQRDVAGPLDVRFQLATNEDLAATSVWGTQVVPTLPGARVDGVLGVWYGKAPGADRSGDAFRHGNFVGAHPLGGMLAISGDDPSCRSSTIPSETETAFAAMQMPVVSPGSPAEILELGRHAIEASRASGTWFALKIVNFVADAVGTVDLASVAIDPQPVSVLQDGVPYVHAPHAQLAAAQMLVAEANLLGPRLELVRAYARANNLNRIVLDPPSAQVGIVAHGAGYYELREALTTLGLDEPELERLGVRILKLGLIWPVEPEIVRTFARGLSEIIVVEDKGPFVETAVRDILYHAAERPAVVGKSDERGEPLMARTGMLDADAIARAVGQRLLRQNSIPSVEARLRFLDEQTILPVRSAHARLPFFCSGCPHNRSTEVPDDDDLVAAGIGCHGMIVISPKGKGTVTGVTQMGAEGAQWIGQAPFVDRDHIYQNLGDGTFDHSGSLAIRACVAADVNITYKILYNRTVAMTGGQTVQGQMSVPDLTRWLEAEGVRKIIVTAEDPSQYRGVRLASIAEVRPRSELIRSQKELRAVSGVTVLIHDQACAAEKRRLRKRGKLEDPATRVVINERVCEACGDCGQKSHCLSLTSVETEFGRKTQIEQASCNKDYSCIDGDCPSFLTVIPASGPRAATSVPTPPADLPAPASTIATDRTVTIRMMGVGGTGVVTVAQVVGMAALLDGKRTSGLDQTGLAQKGGPVVSDIRIVPSDADGASHAPAGKVDVYLGFDLLGASAPHNLATADPGRTVAVVSTSEQGTGEMVGKPDERFVEIDDALAAIEGVTAGDRNLYFDARHLSTALFDDTLPANTILLGAAWQMGQLPISLEAMREAYRLNGASVDTNLAAFEWGRALVAAPDAVAAATAPAKPAGPASPSQRAVEIARAVGVEPGSDLEALVSRRVDELIAYQSPRYARRYADFLTTVLAAEREADRSGTAATEAVARGLYKLMAYKDEYEVARLHLDPDERARVTAEFGEGARIRYQLHPPVLRALGVKRKLSLGRWFDPGLRTLRGLKGLRGTPFDVFGYAEVRRVERSLPDEYRTAVEQALPALATAPETVVRLCELPDVVRGYEHVKLRNVEEFRASVQALLADLREPVAPER